MHLNLIAAANTDTYAAKYAWLLRLSLFNIADLEFCCWYTHNLHGLRRVPYFLQHSTRNCVSDFETD